MDDFSTDDFLARERAALGNDAGLFGNESSSGAMGGDSFDLPSGNFPELGDGTSSPPPPPQQQSSSLLSPNAGFPDISSLTTSDRAPPARSQGHTPVPVTVEDAGDEDDGEMMKFESEFPHVDELMPAELQQPTIVSSSHQYGASPYASGSLPPAPQQQPQSSYSQQQQPEDDSEALSTWRARQAEEIAARDARSKAKREETITKAEKAIDSFYEEYNAGKERSIKENKENEAAFLSELSTSLSAGTTWERITDLIGLENSQSKTLVRSTPGGSDLARMKEVLLRLRRQGEAAPGAKGY